MSDFMGSAGELSVSIGEGWISAYEVSRLEAGCLVRSEREAGFSAIALFNAMPLAQCEVAFMENEDGRYVAGITLARSFASTFAFTPGKKDDAAELLPFYLRFGAVPMPLGELRGAGPGSFISLGILLSAEEDADLVVAGISAARGKIVVMGENLGIRITRTIAAPWEWGKPRASGAVSFPTWGTPYKDYRFEMPDRFSRRQLETAASIHELFRDNLRLSVSGTADMNLRIDQMTWDENWNFLLGEGSFGIGELECGHPDGCSRTGRFEPAKAKIVESASCVHRLGNAAVGLLAERFAERNRKMRSSVWVFAYGQAPIAEDRLKTVMECLSVAWRSRGDIGLNAAVPKGLMAEGSDTRKSIPKHEMILGVYFSDRSGAPVMAIAYPFALLEPILGLLG